MVFLQGQEPLTFFEEMIARCVHHVRNGTREGLAREPAAQREQRVHEDRRAVTRPPLPEIREKLIFAQGCGHRIFPAEVKGKQMLDET
jgi:hypothetical protein